MEETSALRQGIKQDVADGVAEGVRRVLNDPELIEVFMDTVVATAQRKAAERTGMALFGIVKSLFLRWLVIGVLVLFALKVAGVDVAVKVWRLVTGAAP